MYSVFYNHFMKPSHDIQVHLRRFRRDAEITQQQLAERIGVSRQTILSIEKGKYTPSVAVALQIAQVLGVSVEELFQLKQGEQDGAASD